MPKRFLDDSLLTSPSLASCSTRAQDAWPRFLLCADDFGCFDANPRVLLGRAWPLRQDVSEQDIATWLAEYERAGMARNGTHGGRAYCELTGWFGPHGQRNRGEYDSKKNPSGSRRKTPPPELWTFAPPHTRGESAAEPPQGRRSDSVPDRSSGSQSQTQVFPPPARDPSTTTSSTEPPPASVPPAARCDLRRLEADWCAATKTVTADASLLHQLADKSERAARALTPPADPNDYARRAIDAFARWRDGIENETRRPHFTLPKLLQHFEHVSRIVAGLEPAVPERREKDKPKGHRRGVVPLPEGF